MAISDDEEPQSFTRIPSRDLMDIGKHCDYEYCRQLDFLPFRCGSCHGTFCLDHRSETAHKCPHPGQWAAARLRREIGDHDDNAPARTPSPTKPNVYNTPQCSHPACKALLHQLVPGVHCQTCNRDYCLKHRLKEDHDCAKLTPLGARPASASHAAAAATTARAEKTKGAFARLRAWGKEKSTAISPKPKPNAAAQRLATVNELKRTATGDNKVPAANRLYLHVEASADTAAAKYPKGAFFFDKSWSVGKVLDHAAKKLQVLNLNNRVGGEEKRLRVFHVEGGQLLEFSEKIGGGKVAQGDTIVLLRGVGPPVPDLIQLD